MCRNIKTLYNFDPPATDVEVQDAALQFVRKLSGSRRPSKRNKEAFDSAVEQIATVTLELLNSLTTSQPHRNRDDQQAKARLKSAKRFA